MSSQQQFEAWAAEHRMPLHKDGVATTYAARCTDEAWQAWQASRAALVIELPTEQPGYMYYAPDVFEAIEAAGVGVKP